jgi:hypothetical protein
MVYPKSYKFHDNIVPMQIDEGAFTATSSHVEGGYFASPLADGDPVKLVTSLSFVVTKATGTDVPIGYCDGSPRGDRTTRGRECNIYLYGIRVMPVELATNSAQVSAGDKLSASAVGWVKTTASTNVIALGVSAASGSIAAGNIMPALFGKYTVG